MNKIVTKLLTIVLCALGLSVYAEAPQRLSYQAVIRDSENSLIKNTSVGVKVSLLQGSASGSVVYSETQLPQTNGNGLITLQIGDGTVVSGNFAAIDWTGGPYFIKTEVDPHGGTTYSVVSTAQLLSVPYALHAISAEKLTGGIAEVDPAFTQNFDLSGATTGDVLAYDGDKWVKQSPNYVKNSSETVQGDLMYYDGTNWVSKNLKIGAAGTTGIPISIIQPYLTVNYCIALEGYFPSRNVIDPFIGTITAYGFSFAPKGWATCDGQLMSIAQYTAVFSLVGTYYGGDGRTTFGLPDLRGRVPIHQGQGSGLSNYTIGQKGGSEVITLTSQNLPTHTHTIIYE